MPETINKVDNRQIIGGVFSKRENADKAIERFIRSFTDANMGIVNDDDIVAVIRNREYIDYVRGMGIDILCEPFGADLMIAYMADRPDSMSPIAPKDVPGKDLESVREAIDKLLRTRRAAALH